MTERSTAAAVALATRLAESHKALLDERDALHRELRSIEALVGKLAVSRRLTLSANAPMEAPQPTPSSATTVVELAARIKSRLGELVGSDVARQASRGDSARSLPSSPTLAAAATTVSADAIATEGAASTKDEADPQNASSGGSSRCASPKLPEFYFAGAHLATSSLTVVAAPAATSHRSGFQLDDVLIEVDGEPVRDRDSLVAVISGMSSNRLAVVAHVLRDGASTFLTVPVPTRSSNALRSPAGSPQQHKSSGTFSPTHGSPVAPPATAALYSLEAAEVLAGRAGSSTTYRFLQPYMALATAGLLVSLFVPSHFAGVGAASPERS